MSRSLHLQELLLTEICRATGGVFDLVGVDPRGTAKNFLFNCSETPEDLHVLGTGYFLNETDNYLQQDWAIAGWTAGKCSRAEADVGAYLGTATVARDTMSVVDAIEEDKMLRFWGISYGTTLGQTIAAMFPDRIDRLILDAVQDVDEYYNSLATYSQWTDSDKVFSAIFSECIRAGPGLCELAVSWDDAVALEQAVWQMMDQVKVEPLLVGPHNEIRLTYQQLKGMYGRAIYGPSGWPSLAIATDYLLNGNISTDAALEAFTSAGIFADPADSQVGNQIFTSLIGVQCGDANARAENKEELIPVLDRLMQTSKLMGDSSFPLVFSCSRWNFTAAGKYEGPWENLSTNQPILILSNTDDGHTPLSNAYRASERFKGSVVLETQSYGHGSSASISTCNMAVAAAYFVNGTLPEPGTRCQVDSQPYEVQTTS